MKRSIQNLSVLLAAVALSTAIVWPVSARAEETKRVSVDRLPREVRRTLDEERGKHEVLGVQWVNQDGKEFFRCTVVLSHGQRMIRIQPGGNLLSVEDIREVEVKTFATATEADDWHREHEDRERSRRAYWASLDERVHATARDPERIRWDDCSLEVRATFARESYGVKADYIVRYRDSGRVIYQTNVAEGREHVRMIQVGTDGTLLTTGEFTRDGRPAGGDWHARTIDFEDLPRSVRIMLQHHYPGAHVPHIDMTMRRGQRVYNLQIEEARHDHFLVIDEDGDVLSDITGHDYDSRP